MADDEFIIANLDFAGFYRVQYEENNWRQIIKQLNEHKNQLSPRTRATLIGDIFSFTEAGYFSTPIAFELAQYLKSEFDFLPWSVFMSRIQFYINFFESTSSNSLVQAFLRSLVQSYYDKLTWIENEQSDEFADRIIRYTLVSFACRHELPDCLDKSKLFYDIWRGNIFSTDIPKGFRRLAVCVGINHGNAADFEHAFGELTNMKSDDDVLVRNDLVASLACTRDSLNHVRLFDFFVAQNNSDVLGSLLNVANQPGGYLTSWSYLKTNWNSLYQNYNGFGNFTDLVKSIGSHMKYEHEYEEMKSFFNGRVLIEAVSLAVDESMAKVKSNVEWYAKFAPIILEWLKSMTTF